VVEVADVRRKFRARIEQARRAAEAHRAEADRAAQDYELFLRDVATPALRMVASVLSAEGYPFKVFTPAGSLRLASDKSREDFFEIELEIDSPIPQVTGRVNRSRGGRVTTIERPIRDGARVAELTQDDVVQFVLDEIGPFL
jgi:hypothetical protein